MKPLIESYHLLDFNDKKTTHINLCCSALEVWNNFIKDSPIIKYSDSVIGISHTLENKLLNEAYQAVLDGEDSKMIKTRFQEPIAALQDEDLEFPTKVASAYYAIYNLFRKYILFEEIDDWLIIKQVLSCFEDPQYRDYLLAKSMS